MAKRNAKIEQRREFEKIRAKLFRSLHKRSDDFRPLDANLAYVQIPEIERFLTSPNSQIMHGRRGVGKTHLLKYAMELELQSGNLPVYISMRSIGYQTNNSNSGIDDNSIAEFLKSFLEELNDRLMEAHDQVDVFWKNDKLYKNVKLRKSQFAEAALNLVEAVSAIEIPKSYKLSEEEEAEIDRGGGVRFKPTGISIDAKLKHTKIKNKEHEINGDYCLQVSHNKVAKCLSEAADSIDSGNLIIFIDEWCEVPEKMQPLVGEFIKRTMLNRTGIRVVIAAIKGRANWYHQQKSGNVGLELGADIFATLDIDNVFVQMSESNKIGKFFQKLLYRHYIKENLNADGRQHFDQRLEKNEIRSFCETLFTPDGFREILKACEGIPRDAFSILEIALEEAQEGRVGVQEVRAAAHEFYNAQKRHQAEGKKKRRQLMAWLIQRVVSEGRETLFLVPSHLDDPYINELNDHRAIHLIKRGVARNGYSGLRFDRYKIDYCCYVSLLKHKTSKPKEYMAAKNESLFYNRGVVIDLYEFYEDFADDSKMLVLKANDAITAH